MMVVMRARKAGWHQRSVQFEIQQPAFIAPGEGCACLEVIEYLDAAFLGPQPGVVVVHDTV